MSFFRYAGGKSKLRSQISGLLVNRAIHDELEYREPFFGGGSIGLKFLESQSGIKKAWINDKDIGIACLWTSVIQHITEFKQLVMGFIPSVKAFHDFKRELLSLDTMPVQKSSVVDIGFKKLAIHQISYSGLGTKSGGPLGGEKQQSDYKIDCRWSPFYICKKAEKMHQQLSVLSLTNNQCTNFDFGEVISGDGEKVLMYLDPPYYVKGNDLYQERFTVEDHERLSKLLKETRHDWVLSYDDCKEVRELYEWADLRSVDVNYSITATKDIDGKRFSRIKPELLICSKEREIYV